MADDYTRQEWDRIQYIRNKTNNPHYKLTKKEALKYARRMGMSDSLRGIAQLGSGLFRMDDATEKLKTMDHRLHKILENPEYGTRALGAFMGMAMFADPLNLAPGAGLVTKAKTIKQAATYGSLVGGTFGALGYVSEESPGLIGDNQSRIENMALGAGAGGILGGLAGGAKVFVSKMRGKPNPFRNPQETPVDDIDLKNPEASKNTSHPLEEQEVLELDAGVLKINQRVETIVDDTNTEKLVGRVDHIDKKQNIVTLSQVNTETGEIRRYLVPLNQIRGQATKPLTPTTTPPQKIEEFKTEANLWTTSKSQRFDKDGTLIKQDQLSLGEENIPVGVAYNKFDKDSGITYRVQELQGATADTPTTWQVLKIKDGKVIGEISDEAPKRKWSTTTKSQKGAKLKTKEHITIDEKNGQSYRIKKNVKRNVWTFSVYNRKGKQIYKDKYKGKEYTFDTLKDIKSYIGTNLIKDDISPRHFNFSNKTKAQQTVDRLIKQDSIDQAARVGRESPDAAVNAARAAEVANKTGADPSEASTRSLNKKVAQVVDEEHDDPVKLTDPVLDFYQKIIGTPVKNAVFNNWGSSFMGTGGGIYGYNSIDDPNATMSQKLAQAALWGSIGAVGAKVGGKISMGGNETLGNYMSKMLINNHGLNSPYLNLKQEGLVAKNRIIWEFQNILIKAKKNLSDDQNKLLYNFMNGDFHSLDELLDATGKVARSEVLDKTGKVIKDAKGKKLYQYKVTPEGEEFLKSGKLTTEAIEINDEARELITKYAQELVDLDLLNKDTFTQNINMYLHRSYAHQKDAKNAGFFGAVKKMSLIGDELHYRGEVKHGIEYRLAVSTWKKKGYTIIDDPKNAEQISKRTGTVAEKEAAEKAQSFKVTIRRNYTKEERIAKGEMEDAGFAIAETGRLLAHDVSMARFFRNLAEDTDPVTGKKLYTLTTEEFDELDPLLRADWVKVPDTTIRGTKVKAYGELAEHKLLTYDETDGKYRYLRDEKGKILTERLYIRKEIFNDLRRMVGIKTNENKEIEEMAQGIQKLTGVWKKLKTAWIPAVHVNNTLSNVALLDFSGTDLKYLKQSVQEFLKKDKSKLFNEGVIQGIFDVDMISRELNQELGSAFEQALINMGKARNPVKGAISYTGQLQKYFKGAKKLTTDKMEKLYQLEDHIFRMAVFMDRVDKAGGLAKLQRAGSLGTTDLTNAALDARKWFIDYDINAPVIDWMRRYSTPFISYTYRVIPLLAEAAIVRPHKMAKWALFGYMLNKVGEKFGGGDEDLERHTMREELTRNLYDLPFMPHSVIKMPFRSANGDSQYLDISRFTPGGDIYETREEGIPGIPTPLQPSFGIWGDVYNTFVTKKDPFTGQDIKGLETDQFPLMKDFVRKMTPNIPFVPGSYAWKKRKQAQRLTKGYDSGKVEGIDGETFRGSYIGSPYSSRYSPLEAWLYGFGIKLRPQNWQANIELKRFEYKQEVKLIDNMIYQAQTDFDRTRITFEEKKAIFERAEKLKFQLIAEWQQYQYELNKHIGHYNVKERQKDSRETKVIGGLVEGKEDVPFTDENPAERINPITGEPYLEEKEEGLLAVLQRRKEERLSVNVGGLIGSKRDYKDEYKKFQSSDKMKEYRAELNKYNRQNGTYGNNDKKDASHRFNRITGFEDESKNRGRAEKSRLKAAQGGWKVGGPMTNEEENIEQILSDISANEDLTVNGENIIGDHNIKLFMRRMAVQESQSGKDQETYVIKEDKDAAGNVISRGGLGPWQIDEVEFNELQRRLSPNSTNIQVRDKWLNSVNTFLQNEGFKKNDGTRITDFRDLEYEDLKDNNQRDLLNAISTRLILKTQPDPIGNTIEEQALYWKDKWNTQAGSGKVDDFIKNNKERNLSWLQEIDTSSIPATDKKGRIAHPLTMGRRHRDEAIKLEPLIDLEEVSPLNNETEFNALSTTDFDSQIDEEEPLTKIQKEFE